MQAQLQNQAGAALVRHIKWWQHCFFRCLNLASKKDGTFDILSRCEANMFKDNQQTFCYPALLSFKAFWELF